MTLFIVRIWNGERYGDSETDFMIVEANSGTEAGEKVEKYLKILKLSYEGKIKFFDTLELSSFCYGKVTHTIPLETFILDCKHNMTKAQELYKNYLEEERC